MPAPTAPNVRIGQLSATDSVGDSAIGTDAIRSPAPTESDPAQAAPQRPLRIVIVDDDRDSVEAFCLLLTLLGHQTTGAYSGAEAMALAATNPDVMMLDLALPRGMNGCEVARQLRATTGDRCPLLIAVSGYGRDDDVRRCYEAGFDHHVLKPIRLEELQRLLAKRAAGAPSP